MSGWESPGLEWGVGAYRITVEASWIRVGGWEPPGLEWEGGSLPD